VYPNCKSLRKYEEIPDEAKQFIRSIEKEIGVPIVLIGTGPRVLDIIDLRSN
jgi:adenylosuccinate synthase